MREREFSISPEAVGRQIQLATELKITSDILSQVFPRERAETWHAISPTFERPKIGLILGIDLSDKLHDLAQRTRELHVSLMKLMPR